MYLGVEERGYVKVLQDFTKAVDADASMINIEVNKPSSVRGFALNSRSGFFAYLHAFTNHQSKTTDITVNVNLQKSGTATWIEPATGRILVADKVSAGRQTLTVPPFLIDVALKVSDSRSAVK